MHQKIALVPKLAVVVGACLAVSAALSGCAKEENDRQVTVLMVDSSGSTAPLRKPGGAFATGIKETVNRVAADQGILWAAQANGSTVASNLWKVNGNEFKPPTEGGDKLMCAELATVADDFVKRSEVQDLTKPAANSGSDLLGALKMASRVYEDHSSQKRNLVLLTDGGVNVGVDPRDLDTPAKRAAAIERLKKSGELPEKGLTGGGGEPVSVWIGGLGFDPHATSPSARKQDDNLIAFWRQLIPAIGGKLIVDDTTLRLEGFPNPCA